MEQIEYINNFVDTVWVLYFVLILFSMQVGFTMLEAGLVRRKNSRNIVLKNLVDFLLGAAAFYFFGFGLSYHANGGIFGNGGFFTEGFTE